MSEPSQEGIGLAIYPGVSRHDPVGIWDSASQRALPRRVVRVGH